MVVNPGKNEMIEVEGKQYRRLCIKTHVITDADNITDVVMRYAAPEMQEGDTLFITEKAVACTQKRAIPMKEIKPRPLAKFLCKFVLKTPYGIGLGIPETMEMAIRECGTFRILVAAAVSAVGKLFGIRGWQGKRRVPLTGRVTAHCRPTTSMWCWARRTPIRWRRKFTPCWASLF